MPKQKVGSQIYIYNPTILKQMEDYLKKMKIKGIRIHSKLKYIPFQPGDVLYIDSLQDLGKSLQSIIKILNEFFSKKVFLIIVQGDYNTLKYKNTSKVLKALKDFLTLLNEFSVNHNWGRPLHSKNKISKIENIKEELMSLRSYGKTFIEISSILDLDYKTIVNYCKELNI
jgi:hypothetical protein